MSILFVAAVFWWFVIGIGEYTGGGRLLAAIAVAAIAPLLQPQFVAVALVHRLTRSAPTFALRAGAVALSYCAAEWIVPKLFGDTIGHGLYASRHLRQAADLAGAPGLTFVLLLVNVCLLETGRRWTRSRNWRAATPAIFASALVVTLFGYGVYRLRQLEAAAADAERITAAIIQANISHYAQLSEKMGSYAATRHILDAHFRLSEQALREPGVDLLVWPETVYPTTFGVPKSEVGAELDREIIAFAGAARIPLIFGAYDADGAGEYNAAIFLQADGARSSKQAYRKGSLFPLTERTPWPLDTQLVRSWWPWLGTWQPGDAARVMAFDRPSGKPLRIAPLICYDAVDAGRVLDAVDNGAELIVTLSNDSWFSAGGGPWLHLVVSAFRSLETRRAQVRATNTGVSALITPTGDIDVSAGVGEQAVVVADLPLSQESATLMLAWGDWFGSASAAAAAVFVAACLSAFRRRPAPA